MCFTPTTFGTWELKHISNRDCWHHFQTRYYLYLTGPRPVHTIIGVRLGARAAVVERVRYHDVPAWPFVGEGVLRVVVPPPRVVVEQVDCDPSLRTTSLVRTTFSMFYGNCNLGSETTP